MPDRRPQSGSLSCGRDAWGDVNSSISAVEGFCLSPGVSSAELRSVISAVLARMSTLGHLATIASAALRRSRRAFRPWRLPETEYINVSKSLILPC
jgi:hypothetical protein